MYSDNAKGWIMNLTNLQIVGTNYKNVENSTKNLKIAINLNKGWYYVKSTSDKKGITKVKTYVEDKVWNKFLINKNIKVN